MVGELMTYADLREQATAVGIPSDEFVRGRKSAGTLVERRPHIEPAQGGQRYAVFYAPALIAATANVARCGRVRIGPGDI